MHLTGRESEMDRQAIAVHNRVNLTRQPLSRATHILVIDVRDAGSVHLQLKTNWSIYKQ